MNNQHTRFAGNIPQNYDQYLSPLFFEPYGKNLVQNIDKQSAEQILEIASGTGVLTRCLLQHVSPTAFITATDLNEEMLWMAQKKVNDPRVLFKVADAQVLPFDDDAFDVVVSQFGYMFMNDKAKAFNEAFRVLQPGGKIVFNTWHELNKNSLTQTVQQLVQTEVKAEAAHFYNTPFSMYNEAEIERLLQDAGFTKVHITNVELTTSGVSAIDAVKGLLLGTPAFNIISQEYDGDISHLVQKIAKTIGEKFGNDEVKSTMNALVCTAKK